MNKREVNKLLICLSGRAKKKKKKKKKKLSIFCLSGSGQINKRYGL